MNESVDIIGSLQRAQRAYNDGRMSTVESECRKVLARDQSNAEAWVLLATVAQHNGALGDAVEMMRNAVQLRPDNVPMREVLASLFVQRRDWRNAAPLYAALHESAPSPKYLNALAKCDWGEGRYERALERFRLAAGEAPGDATCQVGLAQACISLWRYGEARKVLARFLDAGPDSAMAWLLLSRLDFDESDLRAALSSAERAAACSDATAMVHLDHAAMQRLAGRQVAAREALLKVPDAPGIEAHLACLDYALSHIPPARILPFGDLVLERSLEAASVKGLTLEFGVFHGRSLRLIAERVKRHVHGFDSFRGLPENWTPRTPAGSYSTEGKIPRVPEHVELHQGWFEDTLPEFVRAEKRAVRLAHLDCDLYSSTRTVLENLRPLLRKGTVLVFDDYLGYPEWREHEHRAFHEFAEGQGIEFRYLCFSLLGRPAAVELTRV